MADYKDIISGTIHSIRDKARELANSEGVKNVVDKLGASSVADIYSQGADRAKAYGRITRLTLELNGDNTELGRVYAEIGRLYFEQSRDDPGAYFVPLFAQASQLTEAIHRKEEEIAALKANLESAKAAPDVEVEIAEFEEIVNATEADGAGDFGGDEAEK